MRGRLIVLWLFFAVIITGCISTSSEPEIVRSEIVPDNTPTSAVADEIATAAPTEAVTVEEGTATSEETVEATTADILEQFAIEGTLRNATTNTIVEEGLEITTLLLYTPATDATPIELYNQTVTSGPDGTFRFENIPTNVEAGFVSVAAKYQELFFPFVFEVPDELDGPTKEIDLFVYEVTTDTTDLSFANYNIFFEAVPTANTGRVRVTLELLNQGNRLIYTGPYAFSIPLPPNAVNPDILIPPEMAFTVVEWPYVSELGDSFFGFEEGDDGLVLQAGIPFPPGRIFFQYSYEVAYQDEITLVQAFNYATEQVIVWVPPQREFSVESEQLVAEPDQFREGNDFIGYSLTTPIESGDALTFTVSGGLVLEDDPPLNTTSSTPIEAADTNDIGILVVGLGMILILSGVLYLIYDLQNTRLKMQNVASEAAPTTGKAELIEQIARLDAEYERGGIIEADYQQQRQNLKEQLRRFYK